MPSHPPRSSSRVCGSSDRGAARRSIRRRLVAGACLGFAGLGAGPAAAQINLQADWVRDNQLREYQAKGARVGSFELFPELRQIVVYDDNIFRQPDVELDDFIFLTRPSVDVRRKSARLTLEGSATANVLRFADTPQENLETYQVNGDATYRVNRVHSFTAGGGYNRGFENRADPESEDDITEPPTLIDVGDIEVGYRYRPGRFGLATEASWQRANFLSDVDADRDTDTFRASARGLIGLSSRIDAFVEGFTVTRDARTDVDRTGVNRDSDTYGANVGVAVAVTEKINGQVFVGFFDFNPDDPTLEGFTDVSAGANLRWAPRDGTNVDFNVFRGDVGTIQNGANGRVDTRFNVGVTQVLRRNLRVRAQAGLNRRLFRAAGDGPDLRQRDLTAGVGAELAISRNVAVEFNYNYNTRQADLFDDEFSAHRVGVGLALKI
ncbi:MAG: outer membrane beta-barrel protein [Parvularculaceae bacterium]